MNENNDNHKIQQLILFKQDMEEIKPEELDKTIIFENVEQEDKIKIIYELKPVGRHYRYSLMIVNSSEASITDVKIKIKFPESMELFRCSPPTIIVDGSESDKDSIKIEFKELKSEENKQINLYLTPNSTKMEGEIRAIVTFVNIQDFIRVLNSEPVNISLIPLTIESVIIPSSQIVEIYKNPLLKKALLSLGLTIDGEINPDTHYTMMDIILKFLNFQYITRDKAKRTIWYFGRCWDKKNVETATKYDVLVIGQIKSGKMEILLMCENPSYLVSLAAIIMNDIGERLLRNKIIASKDQVMHLECVYCGVALPEFPKKGEAITCKGCNYEQLVW